MSGGRAVAGPRADVRAVPGPARVAAWAAAWSVVALALWVRWRATTSWNLVDLADFRRGGQSVLEGSDLYAAHPGVLAFNYPPFAGVLFTPLAVLGPRAAEVAMTLATLTAYVVVLVAVQRLSGIRWGAVVLVGAVGLALEPVVRTLVLGQVGVVLMALVLADLVLLPARWRGLLIGVAAGVKLTPALFVLLLLLRRERRAAVRAVLAAAATVAVGWWAAPVSSHRYWLGGLDRLDRFGDLAFTPVNQSVTSLVARTTGTTSSRWVWVAVAVLALLAGACAVVLAGRGDAAGAVLACAAATLVLSPISWTHHWVWVVPLLLVLVSRRRLGLAALVALLAYVSPMWAVPQAGPLTHVQLVAAYAYLLTAVGLLGVTLVLTAVRARSADRPHPRLPSPSEHVGAAS